MKFLNYLSIAACATMMAIGTSACSDDEPEKEDNGGGIDGGGDASITEVYTPEQSKVYLENTATELLNKFNPDDQKPLIELLDRFEDKYGDLDLPEEFEDDNEDVWVSTWAANLCKALKQGDFVALSRAATQGYSYSSYTGEFEPGTWRWVKKNDSNSAVFRFTDNGQTCELRATPSNGEWSETFDGTKVTIPGTLNVTLTSGSDKLVDVTVNSTYSATAHTLTLDITANVMNLNVVSNLNATDTKITEHVELNISGERVITTNATMNGRNLCNRAMLEDFFDDVTGETADRFFDDGYGEVNVLGRVQVKGNLTDISDLVDALDYDEEGTAGQAGATRAAATLRTVLTGTVHYTNSPTVQATLDWEPYINYDWGPEQWWSARPVIRFNDDAAYAFDGYFGNGKFISVENLFESIFDKYEDIWD